jgi:hypothetical protein
MSVVLLTWLLGGERGEVGDGLLLQAGVEPTPEGQQTGSLRRVKPFAARRLRRSLSGQGLTRLAGLLWPGRAQPRQKETEMSASTEQAPTQRQLRYLRALASNTATTFVNPQTRRDASRQIDRLRGINNAPWMERPDTADIEGEHLAYATAVHPSEVNGFGSSATWRAASAVSRPPDPPRIPLGERTELARYTVTGGERVMYGQRVDGCVRVIDRPVSGAGRSYVVERELDLDGRPALTALVADYLEQARELDEVPMASDAVRQLLAQAGPDA